MDDDLDPVWRALANPLRRRFLDALRDGPRTTGELAALAPQVSRFAVMQHLEVLVEGGLVHVRREGRVRWNVLDPVPIRRIYERWVSRYDETFAAALTSLKAQVENPPPAPAVSRRSRRRPVPESSR